VTTLASDARAAAPHPSSRQRRETATFAMWAFLGSELMFFGGLLFAYAWARYQWPAGFAAASRATDVAMGTANTALLLTSSFLVALAVAAGARPRRQAGRLVAPLLAAAALLGVVFLMLKGVEYRHDWQQGFFPGAGFRLPGDALPPAGAELFAMLYFTATAVHALHLALGVAWLVWLADHTRRRPIALARLEVAGLYWHFVDIVWIFLYPLLYLAARS
jgi:cytochrome c oxidase subunit 3